MREHLNINQWVLYIVDCFGEKIAKKVRGEKMEQKRKKRSSTMLNREGIFQLKNGKRVLDHSWFREKKKGESGGKWYIPEQKIIEDLQLINL